MHILFLALSYLRSQPGSPRARHGELTPRWPLVPELLPLPLLLGLEERPVHLRSLNLQTQQPSAAPCQSSRQPSLEGGRVNLDLAEGIEEPISAETTPTDPLDLVPH